MRKQSEVDTSRVPFWWSCRLLLAFIGFLGTTMLYALRMNLSVAILCMTNNTAVRLLNNGPNASSIIAIQRTPCADGNSSSDVASALRDGPFVWNSDIRGIILGVFFWGYLVTQIPAGLLAQRFGPKIVVGIFMSLSALTTILLPIGAAFGPGFVIFLRVLTGMGSGVWFPCMHHLWAQWAPPLERSKLVGFTYAGIHVGNAITLPLASLLCEYGFAGGWPSIFYIFGIFTLAWVLLWGCLAYNGPTSHPRITEPEQKYILASLKGQVEEGSRKVGVPLLSFIKSRPVWAILMANITFDFGAYFFMTCIPTYMKDVLGFNIKENGFLSAVPYIGFWAGQVLAAYLADLLQSKKILGTTATRKVMTGVGMLSPGILVIILGFLTCNNRYTAVVLLTIGLTANGACFAGIFVNHVDIAPRYAGVLFAICNSIASITGFFAPYVVGAVTTTSYRGPEGTQAEWRIVFFICSSLYIFGGLFYLVFASGELQPWAAEDNDKKENGKLPVELHENEFQEKLLGEKKEKENEESAMA